MVVELQGLGFRKSTDPRGRNGEAVCLFLPLSYCLTHPGAEGKGPCITPTKLCIHILVPPLPHLPLPCK